MKPQPPGCKLQVHVTLHAGSENFSENWSSSCFLGYLVPAIRHTAVLPQEKIRNVREIKKPVNPVGQINARWKNHHAVGSGNNGLSHMDLSDTVISWAGVLPAYGATKSIWELRKLSKLLEIMSNATFSALELVTDELTAMRTVVLQNRMALHFTLAARGGACASIQEECCSYIPDHKHEIDNHLEVIQQVSAMIKPGPNPLMDFFQKLFGGWGSILMTTLIAICVGIILLVVCVCCFIPLSTLVNLLIKYNTAKSRNYNSMLGCLKIRNRQKHAKKSNGTFI